MRNRLAAAVAALPLVAACATVPPLHPADPAQAVAHDRAAATAADDGVRITVRPNAWTGGAAGLDEYLTPVDVQIQNGSGRPLRVSPASFSLVAPNGFRYAALPTEAVRHALGPYRGVVYGGYGYSARPWGWGPYAGWGGPWGGWWGWGLAPGSWWGAYPYDFGFVGAPSRAFVNGTLDAGGHTTILVFFPVPETSLAALVIDASLVDTSGQKVASVHVPFARGKHPVPMPLAPTAGPQAPGTEPPAPAPWTTEPPPSGQQPPAPPVDTPIGPAPDGR
jgi:hypothetical protein